MAGVRIIERELNIVGLTHRYGPERVIDDIDLSIAAGEAVALVGPSGSGKTTLLGIAAGLITPWEGRVHSTFARPAMMFQEPRLLPWQRTLDNIALGLKALGHPRRERCDAAAALAQRLGLGVADLDKFPAALSGGMQSRVALARALAIAPDLLLLDEPFAALDVGLKHELHALLAAERQRSGVAVLMITHDVMEALCLADRIVVLAGKPGRIVATTEVGRDLDARDDGWLLARTAEFLRTPNLRAAFALPPLPTAERVAS